MGGILSIMGTIVNSECRCNGNVVNSKKIEEETSSKRGC